MTSRRISPARGARGAVFIRHGQGSVRAHSSTIRHCHVDSAFLFARARSDAAESVVEHLQAVQV